MNYGIVIDVKYQVLDANSNPINYSSMEPFETGVSFLGATLNNDVGPSRISTTSKFTAGDGTFHDAPFGVCQNLPFTSGQTKSATQNLSIILGGSHTQSVANPGR